MKSIFSKTFLSSLFLTLAVICVSFLLSYLLMPRLYTGYKNDLLANDLAEVSLAADGKPLADIKSAAVRKADEKGYLLNIYDESGAAVASHGIQTVTSYTVDATDAYESEGGGAFEIEVNVLSAEREITDSDGSRYSMVFMTSLEPVDEAKAVVLRLLPIVLAISAVLAALFAWLHARRITRPVESISKTVSRMKDFDADAKCECSTGDEIESLAEDINELYARLKKAIDDLQSEFNLRTAADKERIDLMLAVSHEIKTPLTAVRGMLECMQYDVGVYKDHATYLQECSDRVDEMTGLINETLAASKAGISGPAQAEEMDLGDLAEELRSEYELIAMKRGVNIEISALSGVKITAPRELLKKALSNIVSNAVKYSDKGGTVRIRSEGGKLVVENPCTPLGPEEIQSMFLPFVRKEGNEESGHGLGLYITDRILKVCGMEYVFEPMERGMRFTIDVDGDR